MAGHFIKNRWEKYLQVGLYSRKTGNNFKNKFFYIFSYNSLKHLRQEYFLLLYSLFTEISSPEPGSMLHRLLIFYYMCRNNLKKLLFRIRSRSIRKSLFNQRINIVVASDDNYALHLSVMLVSLLENSAFRDFIDLYVLDGCISQMNKQRLCNIAKKYRVYVTFIPPDITKFTGLITRGYLNISSYYRLLTPEVLPSSIQKVLYLDCDLIVKDDITKLWQKDITDYFIAAVEDAGVEYYECFHNLKERLSIPKDKKYFNSGVMLINLELWRQNNIHNKILKFISENPESIIFNDQDGLNKFLINKWLPLDPKWNQQPTMFTMVMTSRNIDLIEAVYKPGIIHFAGEKKPWHASLIHPYRDEYFRYLSLFD